ncbi:tRNA(Ile)-lysidine synthase [Azomonas macrocytogenes]|uniref:tRNA(Ile)-lysidine synthase n=1 Tax=Azomonas macrocytogenes TaxID=69962 RepID=A0A839T5Z2_AZOMA|nr:tRNA(Ile)-lysidine synthase [Azomonas macrocytogenes]
MKGLAGMPGERMLGQGRLVRPLLSTSRQELELYARSKRLHWIEDPSNENLEFSRNYLRQRIIPALLARWPQTQVSLARTASHMAEAQELLGELARIDLQTVKASSRFEWLRLPSLNFAALLGLSPVRQRNLLRYWLADFTLLPETGHWDGWDSLRDAASDAMPRWRLASGELVRANDFLWFLPKNWFDSLELRAQPWVHSQQALDLPGNGRIWLQQGRPGKVLEIRYRQGGEVISIPGRGRRDLKRLLNEAGIPSFVRYRLPLLYADNVLVAVANLPHCSMNGYSIGWVPPGLR